MHKMRNLTVEDISPGCVRLRICVEYVIGVYTLTKQAGGFFPGFISQKYSNLCD